MSKSLKLLLWAIVTMLYFIFACWCFFCCCLERCDSAVADYDGAVEPVIKINTEPIVFDISNAEPVTIAEHFPDYKSMILTSHGQDSILRIIGYYTGDEDNNTEYENLGLARAAQVRALFPTIPDSLIGELLAIKRDTLEKVGDKFKASELSWSAPEVVVDAAATEAAAEPEYRVENIAGQQLIYFPSNSAAKIANSEVDDYLNQLVERVKATGEKIELIGHTDDQNSDEYNQVLGQKRADAIKNILIQKGIPAEQISSISKGESEAIASNTTEKGRASNRRVELKLIKQQ